MQQEGGIKMSNILIAYFSKAGQNYVSGSIQSLPVGNTEVAAKMIQRMVGDQLFKIESVAEYPDEYHACTEVAQRELRAGARPELTQLPDSIELFDTIILGYPNWWATMPMPVYTFLEKFDFSGKTILPYCTHEGSGMSRTEEHIKEICPGAVVKKGLAIHGADVKKAGPSLEAWLKNR